MRSGRVLPGPLSVALAGALVAVLMPIAGPVLVGNARGDEAERCARFAFQSAARERILTGSGPRVAVLGDSYSVGLGLRDPRVSWPARLAGRVEVFGFSGSGFAADSSPCPSSSYGVRARGAAAAAEVVVVEGGLNDVDRSDAAIRTGVRRVLAELRGHRVLLVGPVAAPSRAGRVSRVDSLLARESARAGVPYLSMLSLQLPYLADGLHLTTAGHREFGDAVAARLRSLD